MAHASTNNSMTITSPAESESKYDVAISFLCRQRRSICCGNGGRRDRLATIPEAVLAYLARYTHRVAISNRRLIAADAMDITFKYKDYRIQGPERYKLMTLATDEFIRRFLIHVLPKGFHRIRNYGLLANGSRADNVAKARALLNVPKPDAIPDDPKSADAAEPPTLSRPCPCCGGRMLIIETFARGCKPRYRPATASLVIGIDTS